MNRKKRIHPLQLQLIDLVPALSGLIGKTALVTSFAVVWGSQLNITNPNFVFENVRIEMIIGSVITLLTALFLPNTAPSGTLAPLIVLVPAMAAFGVHPFILSILVGIIGIVGIKTKLLDKLVTLSGSISRVSLTLTFGISGILLSIRNLVTYFEDKYTPLFLLLITLSVLYIFLRKWNKVWLIVPVAATISVLISLSYGFQLELMNNYSLPSFHPSYWWNELWGIGFGFEYKIILKTLPYAFFVLLLWAIDTISITTMLESNDQLPEEREKINLNSSFTITSLRNIVGGIFGGAQTSALWRSFLIPLFMVKRPLRPASILMGCLGIFAGFLAIPIKVMSFPPLVWSVLLYGIFLPFVVVGFRNLRNASNNFNKIMIVITALAGIIVSPMVTWVSAIIYEKVEKSFTEIKNTNN